MVPPGAGWSIPGAILLETSQPGKGPGYSLEVSRRAATRHPEIMKMAASSERAIGLAAYFQRRRDVNLFSFFRTIPARKSTLARSWFKSPLNAETMP
jgi:hypothetical protein